MADFNISFNKGLKAEGGYHLINVSGDLGGETYAGISRNNHPRWLGWGKIDNKQFDLQLIEFVTSFYKHKFWNKILGSQINSQKVADNIYLASINIGSKHSVKITQSIINCKQDGIFGEITLRTLNNFIKDKEDIFLLKFQLLNVFRYKDICLNDKRRKKDKIKSNLKFLCGWINRIQKIYM